jgi:hypothetical protein
MLAGHAAGVAAAQAVKANLPPRRIDIRSLQQELRRQKQIVSLN